MAKITSRERRKLRIRGKVSGSPERPRLTVFRSARHIYAQVTQSADLRTSLADDKKLDSAKKVGALIAKICLARNVDKIVFDRNGYLYHGRVKALAEAARKAGLKF